MNRIAVAVTSATLLSCPIVAAAGQAKNGGEDSSHSTFKVLNGSHANPRITLTELLDSYEKAIGGREAVDKIRTIIVHEKSTEIESTGEQIFGSAVEYFKYPNKVKSVFTTPSGRRNVHVYDGK